jgi:hypothetical protein
MNPVPVVFTCLLPWGIAWGEPVEQIGWRDLTVPIEADDDPYYGLSLERRNSLDTLLTLQRKRQAGEAISDADAAAEQFALEALESNEFDGQDLLAKEAEFRRKLVLQRTTVREEWNNRDIKIPGYLVPLDYDGTRVVEFLLVPYAGACIHTPPPPANQIILVRFEQGLAMSGLFTPVWVSGHLSVDRSEQSVSLSDGTTAFEVGYAIEATEVVEYR